MTDNGYGPNPGTPHDGPQNAGPSYGSNPGYPGYPGYPPSTMPPLRRSRSDRMVAGVCGGIARSLRVDVTLVRIIAVLTAVFTGGAALLVYLVAIVVIPDDTAPTYPTGWQPYAGNQPDGAYPPPPAPASPSPR